MRRLAILLLLLAGCSGGGGGSQSGGIPAPAVGQWVTSGASPQVANNAFSFHCCDPSQISGYYYTQLPAAPRVGQTLTLNYSVDGDNPQWQNNPSGGDSGAPTLHLFLWRKGDDLSCGGNPPGDNRAQYRMFAARTPLVLGDNQTVSAAIDPSVWTGCYGAHSTAAQWSDLLNNLLGAGFTFGGQNFAGHGIYLSGGLAAFKINSFMVQ